MTETRYPRARFVGCSPENHRGPLEHDSVTLFVIHIAEGLNQSGTDAWFNDPAAQVSAHFSIARDGTVHQYLGIDEVAWHCWQDNDRSIGIEHEGDAGMRLTRRQLAASLRLLDWLHEQFPHVPLHRTANAGGRGVIGHEELGYFGGDHPGCPGVPVLYQFNVALRPVQDPRRHWHLPLRFKQP